jgi:hypothetical protein
MAVENFLSVAALIAQKKAGAHTPDGSLEVAMSIAAVTDKVTVDATANPFSTTPDDLFDRTFKDSAVGMGDNDMNIFKANLSALLFEIKSDINAIPENADEKIGDVAEFVRLSLLQAGSNQ